MILSSKTKMIYFHLFFLATIISFVLPCNAANTISQSSKSTCTSQTPVSVDSYGAIGDGIHDDSAAIQEAFDNNSSVCFTAGKTYKLISNGLYIRNDLTIYGNNSTILIDDSYNPTKTDFSRHIIRHAYNSQSEYLEINNLNIRVQITNNNYSGNNGQNYLCVLQPTYIDNVLLQNVNITVLSSKNKIINLWLDHGCKSFIMKNSTLKNYTAYKEGGVLWFMSSEDKLFNKYTDFKKIVVSNSILEGTCGDEIISIYGNYSSNATFYNCTIIGNNQSPNTTRPITIYSSGDAVKHNVTFNQCNMACTYNSSLAKCTYDSFIGVGSDNPTNYFDIRFKECSISASVQNCLLYPSLIQKNIDMIDTYSITEPNIWLSFSSCDIICDKPISGSSSALSTESQDLIALNFSMNHCNVICNYSLAVLTPIYKNEAFYYYTPVIELTDNSIYINNCNALIINKYSNLEAFLTNENNNLLNEQLPDSTSLNQNSISYITQS